MIWIWAATVATTVCLPLGASATSSAGRPLVWGLDLGNDNSVVAVASRNGVDVLTNDVSNRQTPSAVYFAGDHRLIGENSVGHAGRNPRNLVSQVKCLLGGDDDVDDKNAARDDRRPSVAPGKQNNQRQRLPLAGRGEAKGGTNGDVIRPSATFSPSTAISKPWFFCETRRGETSFGGIELEAIVRHMGKELRLTAREVVAYLLQHCSDMVTRAAGGDEVAATSCVVASVPSHFSMRQRRAVMDAARIAGVPMPRVIDEGTAVALAYGVLKGGLPPEGCGRPLVVVFVDIGHSCSQVTVASFTASGMKVVGRGCARGCGTAAVEAFVFDRVCEIASGQGITVKGRPRAEFRLAEAVTAAMTTLSANTEARLGVECIDGDKDVTMTLTREDVEVACVGVASGISVACEEALLAAGMAAGDVQDVELLGGGSYVPALRRPVETVFGKRLRRTMSSSESVARGCALAAAQHSSVFKLRPFRVVDRLSRGLRLEWRYQPSFSNGSGRSALQTRTNSDESTGEVDVPAGTVTPWSSEVSVSLNSKAAGGGKVLVHLMEGTDLLASYVVAVDLSSAKGNGVGGSGGVEDFAEGEVRVRIKFLFRVDDGGMPSVHSARLEYEEHVTEFVEVSEAMSATSAPSAMPQRRRSRACEIDATNRNPRTHQAGRGEESEVSASKATSSGREEGGQGVEETTEDGEGKTTASVSLPGRLTEEVAGATAGENGGGDGNVDGGVDDDGDGNGNVGGNVDPSGPRTGEESDAAPERKGGHGGALDGRETPEDLSPGGNGGSNRSLARNKAAVMKVPRVVTRTRSRAMRVEQTYTGILEGLPLEEARERARSLRRQDAAVRLANEARNSLENLVYATRWSLEPGEGDLSAFVEPSEAAAILSTLDETEDWLLCACSQPEEGGESQDKVAFEKRTSSLEQRLAEAWSRRQARVSLLKALDEAEDAAREGDARLAGEARDALTEEQQKHAESELASLHRFVEDVRRKLDAAVAAAAETPRVEYGSLLGRLPVQEGHVRKKMEHVSKTLSSTMEEHSCGC